MAYLLAVSLVWAFSFGLIKTLSGLDPTAVSFVRILLALVVFLPFLRINNSKPSEILKLALVGAVQFGVMYMLYLRAFAYLKSFEIALFTVTTPIYLAVFDAALRRRIRWVHLAAALISVAGTCVIVWRGMRDTLTISMMTGVILIQLSNACFAIGQLAYRRIRRSMTTPDYQLFGWLYAGAAAVTGAVSFASGSWKHFSPSGTQWTVLIYLGVVASGLGFFLWNRGATKVNAGTLAAMNNAKIPLGVACSLLFFGEHPDPIRLICGGALLAAAVYLTERSRAEESSQASATL